MAETTEETAGVQVPATTVPEEPRLGRRATLRLLGRLLAPYRGQAVVTVLLLLCDVMGMLYIPTELSALVNAAISHEAGSLARHGARMLAAAIAGSGGCIASYWMASRLAAKVGRDLRVAVYEKSLDLAVSDFSRLWCG